MKKTEQYHKVKFSIERAHGYGRYLITGNYYGKEVVVYTNDSAIWDYVDDDEQPKKQKEAREAVYRKIVNEYNKLYL